MSTQTAAENNAQDTAASTTLTEDTFFFRPKKVLGADGKPEKDADGKDKVTKRDPFKAMLPYINQQTLIDLLQGDATSGPMLSYLVELCNDKVYEAAQGQVNDIIAAGKDPAQDLLNMANLDIYFLATQPKATFNRGIPKEVWASFKTDFIEVITSKFGVSIDGATKAAKLIADDRMASIRTATAMLDALYKYLNNWFTATSPESQEKYLAIFEESTKKIETYKSQGEQNLLDSIA